MFQGEFTKVTNTLGPELAKTYVMLWDIGPLKPVQPARPKVPVGKDGDPEFELAKIEFVEVLEKYQADLKAYGKAKIEHAEWQDKQGGALEIRMFSCDANDALSRDPDRYFISASTYGHESLKNHGLPAGYRPGKGHADNLRRAAEGDAEFALIRARDPVFGHPMEQNR